MTDSKQFGDVMYDVDATKSFKVNTTMSKYIHRIVPRTDMPKTRDDLSKMLYGLVVEYHFNADVFQSADKWPSLSTRREKLQVAREQKKNLHFLVAKHEWYTLDIQNYVILSNIGTISSNIIKK
jgi:hypothetical protein